MTKISLSDALALVRDFGLLVNQVAIYGVTHKVIQQQAIDFFNRLKPLAVAHETVEFAIQGDRLAVNGEAEGIDPMSSRNLKEKMLLHKLPGIFFSSDLTQDEFLSFISCLGKPPGKVQEMGGFSEVLKKSDMKGVSLVQFVYERVGTNNLRKEPATPQEEKPPEAAAPAPAPVKRPKRISKPKPPTEEAEPPVDPEHHAPTQARLRRKHLQTELGSLLAEVTRLVGGERDDQGGKVVETLRSIRNMLRTSTETSKERIATLLGHEEKPAGAAEVPARARAKKKPPKLSHAEYMSRFAELTQEIAQPLTVTNSVIEILRQGHAGAINEAQTHFLDLALESVDRVNQLIKYMHTLYGEPDSLSPDKAIIQETYV